MITIEIYTSAFYDMVDAKKGEPGATEVANGWIKRVKVDKETIQHIAMRPEGVQAIVDGMAEAGKAGWTFERAFLLEFQSAAPVYSDCEDWTGLRCSDPKLEALLLAMYGLKAEKKDEVVA